jgi:hypothetical protein
MSKISKLNVFIGLSFVFSAPLCFARDDNGQQALNEAREKLRAIEETARKHPTGPRTQEEVDTLVTSNKVFALFSEQDCLNKLDHAGAAGGTGLSEDLANCQTELTNARVAQLKQRYGL